MPSRPIAIEKLIADLRRVEAWLSNTLGVAADGNRQETPDPFPPPDDLQNLKKAVDRIRPLLWVYLNRQNEQKIAARFNTHEKGRSLLEDALAISDRYVGNQD